MSVKSVGPVASIYFWPLASIPLRMSAEYPSRTLDKIVIRLPDGMRDRLAEAAAANKRSVNAEVVARLQQTLEAETKSVTPWLEDREARAMPLVAADIARIIEETSRTAARLTVEQMQRQYGGGPEDRDTVLARLQGVVDVVEERMRESVAAEAKGALSQLSGRSFKDRIRKLDTNVLVDMVNRIEGALEQTPNLLNAAPTPKSEKAR
jgi:plasmid stability protein